MDWEDYEVKGQMSIFDKDLCFGKSLNENCQSKNDNYSIETSTEIHETKSTENVTQ